MTWTTILVLAAGTYAFRIAGPLLRKRITVSKAAEEWMKRGATVLLVGLIATAAVYEGGQFADWALPAGVVVGGVLAWRKAPFVVVVIAAATTAAAIRLVVGL
ncbi:AzlD domain-containing protein [Stackebrandtia nassauensis]|uniref:Branched-chain amino acid transport n=1 Tax=Stackebrandtia nassauensis (strain DSM 44728 / CIP 108903 / NRRL B-16338 / NBRC 102104 / LLR-40K-21) TaxID=446470 RepID=D3Q0L0_STANL|nr:AzlD domain-containing protein [Stackebrandtia nassauensis]ADD41746.1 branched-chain amino acid transport [Stackebrandtia nassauensis DSM 44728]